MLAFVTFAEESRAVVTKAITSRTVINGHGTITAIIVSKLLDVQHNV